MNAELFEALKLLEETKGIPVDYMLEKVEAGLVSAFRKQYGNASVRVDINKEKKSVRVFARRTVVEEVLDPKTEISLEDARAISRRYDIGSVVENEIKPKNFGRISAQTAKQVIVQGIREAEKNNIAREYEKKREDVISAIVTKREEATGDVFVDTGTSDVLLPKSEQLPGEELYVGDRVRVFVTEVTRDTENTPRVTLSRTAPGMIKRMFELEIPEIADGTV
ncbi:MAG: S1 RNA-binding domain-containing protein, partial [Clostridia bacterium]|nr:S1 RNA-binding domain-containing protein [Clostridia bacterium]